MLNAAIDILINNSTVANLLGADIDGDPKVYANICPQVEKFPYVVLRISARRPEDCKENMPTDYTYNFSAYCYCDSYAKVDALSRSVEMALSRESGNFDGVKITEMRYLDMADEAVEISSTQVLHARRVDFEALVDENTAT